MLCSRLHVRTTVRSGILHGGTPRGAVIETQSVANLMHCNLCQKNARMGIFPRPPVTPKSRNDALLSSQVSQIKDAPGFDAPFVYFFGVEPSPHSTDPTLYAPRAYMNELF